MQIAQEVRRIPEVTNLFEEIQNKKSELDRIISDYGKQALQELFTEFFDKAPTIEAVRWVQYIPGFNDGDPCLFTLQEAHALIPSKFRDEEPEAYEEIKDMWDNYVDESFHEQSPPWYDDYNLYDYSNVPEGADWKTRHEHRVLIPEGAALKELNHALQSNPDTLEVVFSSYADVTATRDGFEVLDYDAPY